jgi:hypothetical protein
MCCLRYEQEAYEDLLKKVPKQGAFVETKDGFGTAVQVNLLRQTVKVRLDDDTDDSLHLYKANELCAVPGGRPKDGEKPVSTFQYVPEPEPEIEEPEPSLWLPEPQYHDPALLEDPAPAEEPQKSARRKSRRKPRGGETRVEVRAEEKKAAPRPEPKQERKPEARADGEGREDRPHRGNRKRGKPAKVEVKAHTEGAPKAGEKKPPEQPKKATAAHTVHPVKEEGGKPKSNRRRYYHGKPKSHGGENKG